MLQLNHPALILAPMEGVTDAPMRALQGEGRFFTHSVSEFIRVSHEIPPLKVFLKHIPELKHDSRTLSGMPVHVQLLGGDPEKMAWAALTACQAGSTAIDLNFGCPAPTVNRHDGGATLLKYPDRLGAIVKAVRAAVPSSIPVSAKLRLGWDSMDAIYKNAEQAEKNGASWITIHGRTREQAYRPPAYWKPIGEIRKHSSIPIVANGEIWTLEDFRRCREETGCEHFMIGRGAMADPLLPQKIALELGMTKASLPLPRLTREAWGRWIERFAGWCEQYPHSSPNYNMVRIKQWVRFAHNRRLIDWFNEIKQFQSYSELCSSPCFTEHRFLH